MSNTRTGIVRIIGGEWRGRKLRFPSIQGLRPTPDRVRETVFNWLTPYIQGANCLDCFSGSGALGFEALSRGACSVVMLDKSKTIVEQLKKNAASLKTNDATIQQAIVPNNLNRLSGGPFDIVFLDPPFYQNLIASCCRQLIHLNLLKPQALVYIESESKLKTLDVPQDWQQLHSKMAGEVGYHLFRLPLQAKRNRHPAG